MSAIIKKRKTAGELSRKANADNTKYDALEVGHALVDDVGKQLRISIDIHKHIIQEPEFCVVMVIAKDPLIHNLMRRKFYCWPYLPKPRPNQSVFLYNRAVDDITKRLWVLPSDVVMAELRSLSIVDKRYSTMKEWTDWFYHGWKFIPYKGMHCVGDKTYYFDLNGNITTEPGYFINTTPTYFWEKVREKNYITMPSEHEYFLAHRQELIEAGCKLPPPDSSEPFDFSKIQINNVVDSLDTVSQ